MKEILTLFVAFTLQISSSYACDPPDITEKMWIDKIVSYKYMFRAKVLNVIYLEQDRNFARLIENNNFKYQLVNFKITETVKGVNPDKKSLVIKYIPIGKNPSDCTFTLPIQAGMNYLFFLNDHKDQSESKNIYAPGEPVDDLFVDIFYSDFDSTSAAIRNLLNVEANQKQR
jgi:hypothetical protein